MRGSRAKGMVTTFLFRERARRTARLTSGRPPRGDPTSRPTPSSALAQASGALPMSTDATGLEVPGAHSQGPQ